MQQNMCSYTKIKINKIYFSTNLRLEIPRKKRQVNKTGIQNLNNRDAAVVSSFFINIATGRCQCLQAECTQSAPALP